MRRSSPSSKFVPCLFEGGSAYKLLHYAVLASSSVPIRILISLALTTIFSRSFCDHLWCEQLQTSRGRITTTQKINSLKRRQSLLQNEPIFLQIFFQLLDFNTWTILFLGVKWLLSDLDHSVVSVRDWKFLVQNLGMVEILCNIFFGQFKAYPFVLSGTRPFLSVTQFLSWTLPVSSQRKTG